MPLFRRPVGPEPDVEQVLVLQVALLHQPRRRARPLGGQGEGRPVRQPRQGVEGPRGVRVAPAQRLLRGAVAHEAPRVGRRVPRHVAALGVSRHPVRRHDGVGILRRRLLLRPLEHSVDAAVDELVGIQHDPGPDLREEHGRQLVEVKGLPERLRPPGVHEDHVREAPGREARGDAVAEVRHDDGQVGEVMDRLREHVLLAAHIAGARARAHVGEEGAADPAVPAP
mmetsp:Transcript_103107/g.287188  ORF Transcript_103107/g.287188 Transcript_103107/m.287188 type:complete len:226 (+) Transcript_103107:244-921(+)